MREQHRARRAQERRLHFGFALEHVETRGEQAASVQRVSEGFLVNHRPARGVHEDGRGLHRTERGCVDEVSGRVRERAVQADDVGRGERRAQVVFPSREDDAGAVRGRELGDAAADPPRADDEELLALEALPHHEVRPPLPVIAPSERAVALAHPAQEREDERDRMLGGGVGEDARPLLCGSIPLRGQ